MDLRELDPIRLKRIPEKDVSPRDIRWLSQIDVERAVLEERWGAPEIAHDDFAEWFCFAFSPAAEEAFILLRQVDHPPRARFCPQCDRWSLLLGGCRADRRGPGDSRGSRDSFERRSRPLASGADSHARSPARE
ncbi:hypothetical protein [Streptomyces sp. NBC_00987]|uniref:hypothetical protein n=1 Tax=Streptomyces sp. NBC_00987 TaxID=2903703 RepID=UPI00386A35AF|nr:hypothetical protein OG355_37450 [Streptomyces sp. NBC_00987]